MAYQSIDIVTHCWRYSRALTFQLQSLLDHPPKIRTTVSLFHTQQEDTETIRVFLKYYPKLFDAGIEIREFVYPLNYLLNRSIGRNQAALVSTSDLIWFTDCDYYFGEGCLDSLMSLPEGPRLFFPRRVWISKDHITGDSYLDSIQRGESPQIHREDFYERKEKFAIGGIQIVPREAIKDIGYCGRNKREMAPLAEDARSFRFRGDFRFRRELGTSGTAAEIPNCYRIRQSISGEVDTRVAK